jgi:hypothetical protein
VTAPPDRVVDAIADSTTPSGTLGYALTDSTSSLFVGKVATNGNFDLRRPRGLTTGPRVAVLRGKVESTVEGSLVTVRYGLHPLVFFARSVWLFFLGLTAVVVVPASLAGAPELMWVLAVFTFVIALLFVPSEWVARADRAKLRSDLEATLRRAGSTAPEVRQEKASS